MYLVRLLRRDMWDSWHQYLNVNFKCLMRKPDIIINLYSTFKKQVTECLRKIQKIKTK